MKSNHKKHFDPTDEKLKKLIESAPMKAPHNPWFTRKVMNRLPPRRVRQLAFLEYTVYAIAAIVTVTATTLYWINAVKSGAITIGNLAVTAIGACVFCAILYLSLSPLIEDRYPRR